MINNQSNKQNVIMNEAEALICYLLCHLQIEETQSEEQERPDQTICESLPQYSGDETSIEMGEYPQSRSNCKTVVPREVDSVSTCTTHCTF